VAAATRGAEQPGVAVRVVWRYEATNQIIRGHSKNQALPCQWQPVSMLSNPEDQRLSGWCILSPFAQQRHGTWMANCAFGVGVGHAGDVPSVCAVGIAGRLGWEY
jgi:hypothetical protein